MSTLPPQAYTKDTVAKAYAWLQSQSDDVKALASNMDQLVAMYLRAKRGGGMNAEAPVSSKKFRSDLKELASELNQFEAAFDENPSPIAPPPQFEAQRILTPQAPAQPSLPLSAPEAPVAPPPRVPIANDHPPQGGASPEERPQGRTNPSDQLRVLLDTRSWTVLQDVKTKLNLSSDVEVLRLLITLGYEKAGPILPKAD